MSEELFSMRAQEALPEVQKEVVRLSQVYQKEIRILADLQTKLSTDAAGRKARHSAETLVYGEEFADLKLKLEKAEGHDQKCMEAFKQWQENTPKMFAFIDVKKETSKIANEGEMLKKRFIKARKDFNTLALQFNELVIKLVDPQKEEQVREIIKDSVSETVKIAQRAKLEKLEAQLKESRKILEGLQVLKNDPILFKRGQGDAHPKPANPNQFHLQVARRARMVNVPSL